MVKLVTSDVDYEEHTICNKHLILFGFGIKYNGVFAPNTTVNGFAKVPFFASIQFSKCDLPNKL